jgi:hypothetical protein
MCFSANASFASSALLSIIGVSGISRTIKRPEMMLASVPLLFSIQQFSEGVLWTELAKPGVSTREQVVTYVFIIFGQVVWPIWLPLATILIEGNAFRKKWIWFTLGIGILMSIYLLGLTIHHNFSPVVLSHHIHYNLEYPKIVSQLEYIYFIPTVVPLFLSSHHKIHLLGFLLLLGYATSYIFYNENIFSVWCFFAAAISLYIFFILKDLDKGPEPISQSETVGNFMF